MGRTDFEEFSSSHKFIEIIIQFLVFYYDTKFLNELYFYEK